MRNLLRNVSVLVQGFLLISIDSRPTILHEVIVHPVFQRNRVGNSRLLTLIDSVEDLKHFSSDQLIIPIYEITDFIRFTVFLDSHMDIGYSSHLFFIGDEHDFIFVLLILLHKVTNKGSSIVRRSIVHYYHSIVVIVLVKNRLKVKLVPEILSVVVGRHHDAERQLSLILTHVIDRLQSVLLLLQLLVDLLLLHSVNEWSLDVVSLQYPRVSPLFWFEVFSLHNLVEFSYLSLPHNLLGIVLQKLQNSTLLPDSLINNFHPFENRQILFGFFLKFFATVSLLLLRFLEQLLQYFNPLIQFTEKFEFELNIFLLLLIDKLFNTSDVEGDRFNFITSFRKKMLVIITGTFDTHQLHTQQNHQNHSAGEGYRLDLPLTALIPKVPLLTEGLPPQEIHRIKQYFKSQLHQTTNQFFNQINIHHSQNINPLF